QSRRGEIGIGQPDGALHLVCPDARQKDVGDVGLHRLDGCTLVRRRVGEKGDGIRLFAPAQWIDLLATKGVRARASRTVAAQRAIRTGSGGSSIIVRGTP